MALNLLPGALLLGAGAAGLGWYANLSSGKNGETGAIRAPRRSRRPMNRWTDDQFGARNALGGPRPPRTLRESSRGAPIPRRQSSFVHELVRWVARINCPVAGPARAGSGLVANRRQCPILSRDLRLLKWLGISISQAQIARASSYPARLPAVRVDGMPGPRSRPADGQFSDAVWSVEAGTATWADKAALRR